MTPSPACFSLIRESEGLRLTVTLDVSRLVIGYGHNLLPGEHYPKGITKVQAEAILQKDVQKAHDAVMAAVHVPLTQGMVDSLTDFVFNEGSGAFGHSTLLKLLNAGHFKAAADQFQFWVYSGGVVLPGLVTRRARERAMFLTT